MPAFLICCTVLTADPASVELTADSRLVFAGVEQGRAVLGARDAYAEATGPLERQIRLGSEEAVSIDELIRHAAEQVLPWEAEQIDKLSTVAASLGERLKPYQFHLPAEVLLVRTTGNDESGAAYTRDNAIMLSQQRTRGKESGLERLLAHELFHVLSRHDPVAREKLYALIGFHPCNPITLPDDLQAIRLTNPDAPTLDYYINVEHEGEKLNVVPLLLANRQRFDPGVKSLFGYLDFKLMAIEQHDGVWRPRLRDGQPVLFDAKTNKSYRAQIGDNTKYIIHPDEILADNFVHLLMRTKELPSPEIVEGMEAILSEEKSR